MLEGRAEQCHIYSIGWCVLKRTLVWPVGANSALPRLLGLLRLLGQEDGLDVGEHATLRDGHAAEKLVQLLVVADGQLKVTRDDARLLVVTSGVASQLEHLGGEILQNCSEVDCGVFAHSL